VKGLIVLSGQQFRDAIVVATRNVASTPARHRRDVECAGISHQFEVGPATPIGHPVRTVKSETTHHLIGERGTAVVTPEADERLPTRAAPADRVLDEVGPIRP
jgi:hypothetical protein